MLFMSVPILVRLSSLPLRPPQCGVIPRIARREIESSERLGRHRWVVERTLAWFARFRRLTTRYERRADIFEAFHHLAAGLICLRFVERWSC
jgi:transposase